MVAWDWYDFVALFPSHSPSPCPPPLPLFPFKDPFLVRVSPVLLGDENILSSP